ncbi:MAG: hypothetical protein AAGE61_05305 [Pseudomonadota bacterium]
MSDRPAIDSTRSGAIYAPHLRYRECGARLINIDLREEWRNYANFDRAFPAFFWIILPGGRRSVFTITFRDFHKRQTAWQSKWLI